MRTRKYRLITTLEWVNNPFTRLLLRIGAAPRPFALLETTGRRTGRPRQTPVGNGLRALPYQWDAATGRAMATTPLTVRIDLDPPPPDPPPPDPLPLDPSR